MKIACLLLFMVLVGPTAVRAGEEGRLPVAGRIERLQQALAVDPDNHQLHYRLGVSLLMADRTAEAISHLVAAYPLHSASPEVNFNLALAYERSGELESALIYLEQAERSGALAQPELYPLAGLYFNLALAQIQRGQAEEALPLLEKVLSLAPQNVEARRLWADLRARRGDWQAAVTGFEEVLAAAPGDQEARRYLHALYLNRGLESLQQSRRASAQALFEQALAVVSGDPLALYYLAFLDYQARRYALAGKRASEAYPGLSPELRGSAGELVARCAERLRQGGDAAAAISLLRPLLAQPAPSLEVLVTAGEAFSALDQPAEARAVCQKILENNPAHGFALNCLERSEERLVEKLFKQGQESLARGELAQARQHLADLRGLINGDGRLPTLAEEIDAAAAIRAGEITSLLAGAEAARGAEAFASAREKLERVLILDPGHSEAAAALEQLDAQVQKRFDFDLRRGQEALAAGMWAEARAHFATALGLSPGESTALAGIEEANRSEQAARAGLVSRARRLLDGDDGARARRLLEQQPEIARTPEVRELFAAIDRRQKERVSSLMAAAGKAIATNEFDQARRLLEKTLTIAPGHPEALSALARLEEARGAQVASLLAAARDALEKSDFAAALQRYREILALAPGHREALSGIERGRELLTQRLETLLAAAESDLAAGRWPQAGESIDQLLDLDPYHRGGARPGSPPGKTPGRWRDAGGQ